MTKYLKQPNLSGCGPISLMNALKWADISVSLMDYPKFKKACLTDRDGSDLNGMKAGISKQKRIKSTFVRNVTIQDIDNALSKGNSVIFGYCNNADNGPAKSGGWEGHYVFISRKTEKKYEIINHVPSKHFNAVCKENRAKHIKTKALVPGKFLSDCISSHYKSGTEEQLDCWIISKNS